jgi:hypothetical protein
MVDLVRRDLLVEFQTGGFAPLRTKLAVLAERHRVRLVAPVALTRRIARLSEEGRSSSRRSPRRGCLHDVFDRLVSIPALLANPNFELEVVLTRTSSACSGPGTLIVGGAGSYTVARSSKSSGRS